MKHGLHGTVVMETGLEAIQTGTRKTGYFGHDESFQLFKEI